MTVKEHSIIVTRKAYLELAFTTTKDSQRLWSHWRHL